VAGLEGVKVDKAEQLFDRVFVEFGDDSVAQLGGVHLACEQASQLLAKAIEWGRLAAYLEQSTRYMRYDDRPGGRWRLTVPPEIEGGPAREAYEGGGPPRDGGRPGARGVRGVRDAAVRGVRTDVPAAVRPVRRALPKGAERLGLPVPLDDHREDVRHAPGAAAGRDAFEPRGLRDRSGVRADADPDARASAGGGSRLRRPDARRAPQSDPRVPQARRPPRPRRRLVPLPRGDARRHG